MRPHPRLGYRLKSVFGRGSCEGFLHHTLFALFTARPHLKCTVTYPFGALAGIN